jgi:hypothetical protein
MGSVLLIFLVFCVVLLCAFKLWVLCCPMRFLETMFGSSLPPVIWTWRHIIVQHKKLKRWATRTPSKNRGWTQRLTNGKQFLLLIRHPSCYSYIQSSLVQVLTVIKERKHLRKKNKIHCHLRYGYFVTVNQIVVTTVIYWFFFDLMHKHI